MGIYGRWGEMGNHDQFGLHDELLPAAVERVRQANAREEQQSWRPVPDSLREREPIRKGRAPKSKLSRALLSGSTIFVVGQNKTFGSLYTLAKNHNKVCKTQRTELNDEYGTLVWFEDQGCPHRCGNLECSNPDHWTMRNTLGDE